MVDMLNLDHLIRGILWEAFLLARAYSFSIGALSGVWIFDHVKFANDACKKQGMLEFGVRVYDQTGEE
jgi:hypothetical protein